MKVEGKLHVQAQDGSRQSVPWWAAHGVQLHELEGGLGSCFRGGVGRGVDSREGAGHVEGEGFRRGLGFRVVW